VVGASSVDMTSGGGTLVRPLPLRPADAGVGGVRRSTRGVRSGAGRRRNVGGGSRVGRFIIGKADNLGTSNNKSIEGVGPDVGPLESIVHSGETGEIIGGWLVSASVLHVDLAVDGISLRHWDTNRSSKGHLHAAWVVLGCGGVKGNDLVADQL
jgi:hypothetical protein